MNSLRSEFRKMATVPAFRWLAVGAAVFAVATVLGAPDPEPVVLSRPLPEQEFVLVGAFVRVLIALVGVRLMTDEFQHATIVPTLMTTPRRVQVIWSKALVAASSGAAIGLISALLLIASAATTGHTDPSIPGFAADAGAIMAGFTASGALWAVLGLGVGAIVRSAVAASAGVVAWLLLVEEIVATSIGPRPATFLPGQGGFALALAPSTRFVVVGGAVLAGWALVATLAGQVVMARRDV